MVKSINDLFSALSRAWTSWIVHIEWKKCSIDQAPAIEALLKNGFCATAIATRISDLYRDATKNEVY